MRNAREGLVALFLLLAASAHAGELVKNGGFETGDFSGGWVDGAGQIQSGGTNPAWADHVVTLDLPFSGDYSALIGFKYAQVRGNRFGFFYQDVAIPSNISSATLRFKFRQQGWDGANNDPFQMQIRDVSNNMLAMVVSYSFSEANNLFKDSGWLDDDNVAPAGYSMTSYAGRTVRLYFYQENSRNNFYETWSYVDDVSLVYRRWVDLAVDGDGNDVFGDTGTGAGGSSIRSAEAGQMLAYSLDVENEGPTPDTYRLSVSPPPGWTVTLRYNGSSYSFPWQTPSIPAGSKITAEVDVTVPPGTGVTGYATILNAISTGYANRYDSVRLGTNVVPAQFQPDLVIDSNGFGIVDPSGGGGISYREAPLGAQAIYTVALFNAGVRADSFQVRWAAASGLIADVVDGARIRTAQFHTGLIAPGSSTTYSFRVTVPGSLLGGDYTSFVYAKSLTDTLKKEGVRAVTRVLAPKVDMVICGSGAGIIDATGSGRGGSATVAGQPATVISFPVVLHNDGAVVDSFTISWVSPGAGWSAQVNDGSVNHALPWRTPTMQAFSSRNYILAVTIPAGTSYDTYSSILNAVSSVSANVRESVSAIVSVSSGNEIDLVIDGNGDNVYAGLGTGLGGSSVKTAHPGDIVTFQLTAQNESGENLLDLSWSRPAGWNVGIGDSTSTMRRVVAGTYALTVRIPASCPGGTFDIIIDGVKTNKRYYVDSARCRLVVSAPHRVDALLDGNGDNVYGAAGTGAGGSSLQSTIGGRTIHFTLELQNEGGEAESYRVSWNGVSGWIGRLAGSLSPFTTSSIIPGASGLYTFEVLIPSSAGEGDYEYTLDVVSTIDAANVESVRGRIHISPPPRADLVIDGDGANRTAPIGTGEGGRAIIFGDPGTTVTATLELVNRGGFADSFRVTWTPPAGWPVGAVVLADSAGSHASPCLTKVIYPGRSCVFVVRVTIPAGAALRSGFIIDAVALSRDLEDSVILEISIGSFVAGTVYDDRDHDGRLDAGEPGWANVPIMLSDPGGPISAVSDGAGAFIFEVLPGVARQIVERPPAGMIPLSPDTVMLRAAAVGETLRVDFADVRAPSITPANAVNGPAGAFIDCPHVITAGTSGAATLTASLPAGWIAVLYRDQDGDGLFGPSDTPLAPADLILDPAVPAQAVVRIIARVLVPPQAAVGTAATLVLELAQTLSGTAITATASVSDALLVIASADGALSLSKGVDLGTARPGDVITYTITFSNPGGTGVREIEILDPISGLVDFVHDAFGAGRDVEWVKDGTPVYLTADPSDPDEAMLEMPDGRLHVVLSRRSPFTLEAGASGRLVYKVRIK